MSEINCPYLLISIDDAHDKVRSQIAEGTSLSEQSAESNVEVELLEHAYRRWTDYNIQLMRQLVSDDSFSQRYQAFRTRLTYHYRPYETRAYYARRAILDETNQLVSDAKVLELLSQQPQRARGRTKKERPCVFIGHGRSDQWLMLEKFLNVA